MKVACFSVACVDHYFQIGQTFLGGNAMNQCINFQKFGHTTAMVGAVGDDEGGTRIRKFLGNRGVDISHLHIQEGETASNQMYVDASGERFGVDGAWRDGVYGEYRFTSNDWDFLDTFDIWATHANAPDYRETLRRKSEKQFLAADFLDLKDWDLLEESLGIINIAFFGGTKDMSDNLSRLARKKDALVVLTLGAEGSIAFKGSQTFLQQALPCEKVVDTTGCGDAFQAAFTASYIIDRDIAKALLHGAENGRETTAHYGAIV